MVKLRQNRRSFPVRLSALAAWGMLLLLATPTAFVSGSPNRSAGSESEESRPLTQVEELHEVARRETPTRELIDRSRLTELSVLALQRSTRGDALSAPPPPLSAEQLGRNGCGAPLRC
jgi:hypothetical protein